MRLSQIIDIIPDFNEVTIIDYLEKEVYVNRESPFDIIHGDDQRYHHFLKNHHVYGIRAGHPNEIILEIVKGDTI